MVLLPFSTTIKEWENICPLKLNWTTSPISNLFISLSSPFGPIPLFSIRNIDYDYLNKIGKKLIVIDSRIKLVNKFDIKMNMEIIQRNGIEIKTDFHEINNIIKNEIFPLSIIPRKSERTKVENEFLMNLIENTGIKKVYTNVEINNILSRNLILCVKIDSDISSFRINKIKQQHILLLQLKG